MLKPWYFQGKDIFCTQKDQYTPWTNRTGCIVSTTAGYKLDFCSGKIDRFNSSVFHTITQHYFTYYGRRKPRRAFTRWHQDLLEPDWGGTQQWFDLNSKPSQSEEAFDLHSITERWWRWYVWELASNKDAGQALSNLADWWTSVDALTARLQLSY